VSIPIATITQEINVINYKKTHSVREYADMSVWHVAGQHTCTQSMKCQLTDWPYLAHR